MLPSRELAWVSTEGVETELGNAILASLVEGGWSRVDDHSVLADVDEEVHSLKRGEEDLLFHLFPYEGWTIRGPENVLEDLVQRFSLSTALNRHYELKPRWLALVVKMPLFVVALPLMVARDGLAAVLHSGRKPFAVSSLWRR